MQNIENRVLKELVIGVVGAVLFFGNLYNSQRVQEYLNPPPPKIRAKEVLIDVPIYILEGCGKVVYYMRSGRNNSKK